MRRSTSYSCRAAVLGVSLLAVGANPALAEEAIEDQGRNHFLQFCAVCHGEDAQGTGPYAGLLNKKPANLTMLTKNNDGHFPFDKVYYMIDGRDMLAAHGTRDMPIWGNEWKRESTDESRIGSEAATRARTLELIVYLRSIQQQ